MVIYLVWGKPARVLTFDHAYKCYRQRMNMYSGTCCLCDSEGVITC